MIKLSPQEWQALNILLYPSEPRYFVDILPSERNAGISDLWHTGRSIYAKIPGMQRVAVPRLMASLHSKGLIEKRTVKYRGSRKSKPSMVLYRLNKSIKTFYELLEYSFRHNTHLKLMRSSFYYTHPLREQWSVYFLRLIKPPLGEMFGNVKSIYGLYEGEIYSIALPEMAADTIEMSSEKNFDELAKILNEGIQPYMTLFSSGDDDEKSELDMRRERFWRFVRMVGSWQLLTLSESGLTHEKENIPKELFKMAKRFYDRDIDSRATIRLLEQLSPSEIKRLSKNNKKSIAKIKKIKGGGK